MRGEGDAVQKNDLKSKFVSRTCGVLMIGACCLISAGCGGSKKPWEKTYPAKGVVTFEGKPLAGARITLVPQNAEFPSSVRPSATTNANGEFELTTFKKQDGAPAGEYKAVVHRYRVGGTPELPSPLPNDMPQKYSKPESSDVKLVVTAPKTEFEPVVLTK